MSLKRAIRYLRISTDRQSNFSIDAQDMHTRNWCERNHVEIIDTFIDEGYSARNFDRPDIKRLNDFIAKHYRTIDYLVVNAYDRFSRNAGEALVAIKKLQQKYGVSVVSVNEGVTFDGDDPGSFFYAGLMLLKGEDEIIRNRSRINMGIYQAKKIQGRYLGMAPFGYKNARDTNNKPVIVIDEEKAPVIRYIFHAFLNATPLIEIYRYACTLGFAVKGNSAITKVLKCPAYTSLLHVNAYKNFPEELVEAIHDPIISRTDWNKAQDLLSGKGKPITIISNDLPFRGVLKCHCSNLLTGAPSTGRHGGKFYYYKCRVSGHNNISAKKAHEQFQEILSYLSLPQRLIFAIKDSSEKLLEEKLRENVFALKTKRRELEEADTKLKSVEEKWISNQMAFETYQRWYSDLTTKRISLRAQISDLSADQSEVWMLLSQELDKLQDMRYLFNSSTTLQKQQFIRLGFDSKLYYRDSMYRTPYIMQIFAHNTLILKEKKLLVLDEKKGLSEKVPGGGAAGIVIEPLTALLTLVRSIQVA